MGVHIIYETVVVGYVLLHIRTVVVVTLPCLLGVVLPVEFCVVASLQRNLFREGILVVQFQLGSSVSYVLRAHLETLICASVSEYRPVLIAVGAAVVPGAVAEAEVQEMLVGKAVLVAQLHVYHVHVVSASGMSRQRLGSLLLRDVAIQVVAIIIRSGGGIISPSVHEHSRERNIILFRCVKRQSGTHEYVVAPRI